MKLFFWKRKKKKDLFGDYVIFIKYTNDDSLSDKEIKKVRNLLNGLPFSCWTEDKKNPPILEMRIAKNYSIIGPMLDSININIKGSGEYEIEVCATGCLRVDPLNYKEHSITGTYHIWPYREGFLEELKYLKGETRKLIL